MSATPSVTEEKPSLDGVQKKRFTFRKTTKVADEKQEADAASGSTVVQAPPEYPPAAFTQLFRFSTKFDLFLDALGLLCALGAGAAQVPDHFPPPPFCFRWTETDAGLSVAAVDDSHVR